MTILNFRLKKKFIRKSFGEVWINNQEIGICTDCNTTQPLFYSYVLPSGKVLTQTCQGCFSEHNYFNHDP